MSPGNLIFQTCLVSQPDLLIPCLAGAFLRVWLGLQVTCICLHSFIFYRFHGFFLFSAYSLLSLAVLFWSSGSNIFIVFDRHRSEYWDETGRITLYPCEISRPHSSSSTTMWEPENYSLHWSGTDCGKPTLNIVLVQSVKRESLFKVEQSRKIQIFNACDCRPTRIKQKLNM